MNREEAERWAADHLDSPANCLWDPGEPVSQRIQVRATVPHLVDVAPLTITSTDGEWRGYFIPHGCGFQFRACSFGHPPGRIIVPMQFITHVEKHFGVVNQGEQCPT